jgi:hypothetical protein
VLADKEAALASAAQLTNLTRKQSVDLIALRQDLQDAQRSLSRFRGAGLEPEQISGAAGRIKKLEKALAEAETRNQALSQQVKTLLAKDDPEVPVILPAGLQGKVISTDPKWRFVVLDIGASDGVLEYGDLLLRRGDQLVGKARVSRVQKDRCVANVMSGWNFTEIREGDIAIPAIPQRESANGS